MKYYFVNKTKSIQAKILTKISDMDTVYLYQLYLPHYFIQGDNVSSHLCNMNLNKPIRLQIYTYDAHEVLFDDFLKSEDIKYIQKLYKNR